MNHINREVNRLALKSGLTSVPVMGYLLIILNASQFLTLIPSFIFGNLEWYFHQSIIIVLNILFLLRYKFKPSLFKNIKRTPISLAFLVLGLIFLFELPRFLINSDGRNILLTVLNAIEFFTFYCVLSIVYYRLSEKRGPDGAQHDLLKSYVIFSAFVVLASVAVFILTSLKIIDPTAYPMPLNLSTGVDNDAATLGTHYCFPLHLTIVITDKQGLPFFSDYGVFCGLSHEPHIADYLITPALFFLQTLNWNKVLKFFLTGFFIVFLLMATSTTNLIAFAVVLFVLLLINIKNGRNTAISALLLVVIIIIFSFFSVNELGFAAITAKFDTSSGTSLDYSKNFLTYVVTPKEFWGSGAFNVPFPYAGLKDIGDLFMVLCVGYFILMLIASVKLILSMDRTVKFVGAGCLYFMLHTLKIVQLALIFPYTILIMFFMLIAYRSMKRKNRGTANKTLVKSI